MTTSKAVEDSLARTLQFGNFRIDFDAMELRLEGTPVALEPQVFALLAYLIRQRDRLVSKNELLDELWGHRYVSESALSTQIKSLRKALGDDGRNQEFVRTVRGRGYQFIAAIDAADQTGAAPAAPPVRDTQHNLPRERTRLFGRQHDVERCMQALTQHRLVTILGIGGTGKTRLAARVGRECLSRYADGVWFVDLIPFNSIDAVETGIASAMGISLQPGPARPQLIAALEHRQLLLIVDNCEHLRTEIAQLLDELLEYTAAPVFLSTSRDPLNLPDEYRYALDPLRTTGSQSIPPAVELFNATAARHGAHYVSGQQGLVGQICTHLDGLPLAIELAAAQLRHLSLQELGERLHQRFQVLAGRERSPSGRQSNLRSVLEDTWQMLQVPEQSLLGQLAVFPAQFTVNDIEQLLDTFPANALARLVDLGLITRTSREGAWWRMLETVRLFVQQQQSEEIMAANEQRHADWCIRQLGAFPDDQLESLQQAEWCAQHYADLEAAEGWFRKHDQLEQALTICTGTALMIQLDDGARAREKLQRALDYLEAEPSRYWQARLHATAGLCAEANRAPHLLIEHSAEYLRLAEELKDPVLQSNALLMTSLSTVFTDAKLAVGQLDRAIALGRQIGNRALVDAATCYCAWMAAVSRDYDKAIEIAQQVTRQFENIPTDADNPAYNASAIIVVCSVLSDPMRAQTWMDKVRQFPGVMSFWGIQLLDACVAAISGEHAASAHACLAVKSRLNRATREEFPDVLVAAALLALQTGAVDLARSWLTTIRHGELPIQMYHTICIYRQLYQQIGFDESHDADRLGYEQIRAGVTDWLQQQASAPG